VIVCVLLAREARADGQCKVDAVEAPGVLGSAVVPWAVTLTGASGVFAGTVLTSVSYALFPSVLATCENPFGCAKSESLKDANHAGIGLLVGGAIATTAGIVWLLLRPHHPKMVAMNGLTF
jgi:hypothetical protein